MRAVQWTTPPAHAPSQPAPQQPPEWTPGPVPDSAASEMYERGCVCGERLSNNCAHYLSNAFILAGYEELLELPWVTVRCEAGRVVRAQDMLRWFQERAATFHMGRPPENSGFWTAYQEKPNRRHVMLLDSGNGRYYGTDDCTEWPVQWFYQWPGLR